jgi:predicted transcriptional regulator
MLDDKPRKLLTILFHHHRLYGRPQSIDELVRRLKWSRKQITDSLQELADKHFIVWDPENHLAMKIGSPTTLSYVKEKSKPHWERDLFS